MTKSTKIVLKKGLIEKYIWGHRLHDEQDGMMTFLEFLCVLADQPYERAENACLTGLEEYKAPVRHLLRSLVFNNPYIDELRTDNADEWALWKDRFNAGNQAIKADEKKSGLAQIEESQFVKLKRLFPGSEGFRKFSDTIRILRSAGINRTTNKRWTSNFIFPWGRHCLFLDMSVSGSTGDRRFFGRNGELLYLLLSHADRRRELAGLINKRILDSGHDFDKICRELSFGCDDLQRIPGVVRNGTEGERSSSGCQLPADLTSERRINELTKRRVDILCEDLIAVLNLPISAPDAVLHITRIITLNLFCYLLEQAHLSIKVAQDRVYDGRVVPILCEALQRPSSDLRRCSRELFKENERLSLNAVRLFYEKHAKNIPVRVKSDGDYESEKDEDDPKMSESLEAILSSHRKHWAGIHRAFSKDCGLATKLCTRDYRYAPSDELLETLAATLVPGNRLLLADFLKRAYERYGLIFGGEEGGRSGLSSSKLIDPNEFESNKKRLTRRLNALGLLAWLSDGFEFVRNPYSKV